MTASPVEMFIDLGDMSGPPPSVADGGPARGRGRGRFLRYLVPVLAVLLLPAGAAPAPRSRSVPVADVPIGGNARILIGGGTLFTLSYGQRSTLAAYRLGGGRHWSAPVAEVPPLSLMQLVDGTVVVTTSAEDTVHVHTESFDAATGRRLWSSELGTAFVTAYGILVAAAAASNIEIPELESTSGYELLDQMSGTVQWALKIPDGCVSRLAGGTIPTLLVEVCDTDASLRVFDLADGRTLAARTVPLGHETGRAVVAPDDYLMAPALTIAGRTILVTHMNAPTPTMDAYALDDLRPLWGGVPAPPDQNVQQCGVTLCVANSSTLTIRLDAGTGAVIGPFTPSISPIRAPMSAYALVVGSSSVPVPTVAVGMDTPIAPSVFGPAWLVRANGVPIAPLPGVSAKSCVQVGGYLACVTGAGRVVVWRISSSGI